MKKIHFLLILFLMSFSLFSQNSKVKLWRTLYQQARDVKAKRDKVKQMMDIADENFENFILDILEEQISYGKEKSFFRKKDHEDWIYYTSLITAKLKIKEGAVKLTKLISLIDNPVVKGEMFHNIGKTENQDVVSWLNSQLKMYNMKHRRGEMKDKEPIVYGLLKALEVYKNRSSFPYIFYAAIPNYSEKVRILANNILNAITNDPASLCIDILKEYNDKKIKLQALKYGYNSQSSTEDKAQMAIIALYGELGHLAEDNNYERSMKKDIENLSVQYLGQLKSPDPDGVRAIEQKWDRDIKVKNINSEDTNELLFIIETLEKIATKDAAEVLTKKLAYYNFKVSEDFGTGYGEKEGLKIVLAIVKAIGKIAINVEDININQEVTSTYIELEKARIGGYYESIIVDASAEALKKMNLL